MDIITCDTGELEEGEISDKSDNYTPLTRPDNLSKVFTKSVEIKAPVDSSSDENFLSSDSSVDSDEGKVSFKASKPNKKRKELRLKALKPKRSVWGTKPDKYNIWAQSIQDDLLMENMRGCEVRAIRDRDVESYDYHVKYRLNDQHSSFGENINTQDQKSWMDGFQQGKRRQSNSDDSDAFCQESKRFKRNERIGYRFNSKASYDRNSKIHTTPRLILDLTVTQENTEEEVALDIASKLVEEKEDLLLQVIKIIGKELPIKIFSQTQQIEKEGGMMTINGQRRRTPGGVFLFLLKNCSDISEDDKRQMFTEVKKPNESNKKKRNELRRSRKVQELKESLNLKNVAKEGLANHDTLSLSNPPPSPVSNRESSPDLECSKILNAPLCLPAPNVIEDSSIRKDGEPNEDFLELNCDDMDLF